MFFNKCLPVLASALICNFLYYLILMSVFILLSLKAQVCESQRVCLECVLFQRFCVQSLKVLTAFFSVSSQSRYSPRSGMTNISKRLSSTQSPRVHIYFIQSHFNICLFSIAFSGFCGFSSSPVEVVVAALTEKQQVRRITAPL